MTDSHSAKKERLQVALARFGIASRRGVISLIESGRVSVNGQPVIEKGYRVDPAVDKITVEGQDLPSGSNRHLRYFMLNKPKGVMTTLQDPHAERTVADFFKDVPERIFPVGRLDRDTTGLLLVTNDGELAFRLTHPKFGIQKRYRVLVRGLVTEDAIGRLEKGIPLEEGETAPCKVSVIEKFPARPKLPGRTLATVTMHEGKKRQIRRIFEFVGHRVIELERTHYGPLALGDLALGMRRELGAADIRLLKVAAGMPSGSKPETAV